MDADRSKQLQDFVTYAKRLKGDEKGEAQVFLDRLFRAFSRDGYKEAGATLEDRVKKEGGATGFADLVWRGVVLIEMKKRGEDLSRHLLQAFKYWEELVPGRPRYVVLCNFDEFWVYDFEQDIHQPQDKIPLADLPNRYGPLNFLWPTNERPLFRIDRDKVTREAADLLAGVYRKVKQRKGVTPELAQRFVLQVLVCLFSEDIGLLPKHFFTQLLEDCIDPPKAFDLFRGLFNAMNSRSKTHGGRFKEVDYFNGGIFSESAAMELSPSDEIAMLKVAASFNWAEVSPDIFGTIFQHSMEAKERHAMGAHYTSQLDIMKIVGPTIVRPFSAAIERAGSVKELTAIRDRLTTLRVLDPACGSGNFLYIAYREMRRLEASIIIRQSELSKRDVAGQAAFAAVSPRQFFGMDVLAFAVELAKVTLSLAPKLASDELHTAEKTLPLDNLDTNVFVRDALIDDNGVGRLARGRRYHRQPALPRRQAAQARARREIRQRCPQGVFRRPRHGRLLRLLVPPLPRPSPRRDSRRPVRWARRAGRHPEHPKQPEPRGRAGPYRKVRRHRRGRRKSALVRRGQCPCLHRQLGEDIRPLPRSSGGGARARQGRRGCV